MRKKSDPAWKFVSWKAFLMTAQFSCFRALLKSSLIWSKAGNMIIWSMHENTHLLTSKDSYLKVLSELMGSLRDKRDQKISLFSPNCEDHSSLALPNQNYWFGYQISIIDYNNNIVVVKDPVDSQGHVLAEGSFEYFQSFCLVQGFVCWSSLSLKILFDYRKGPTLCRLKYKLIVNTKRDLAQGEEMSAYAVWFLGKEPISQNKKHVPPLSLPQSPSELVSKISIATL